MHLLEIEVKQQWLASFADLGLLRCFELTIPLTTAAVPVSLADALLASTFRRCDTDLFQALRHLQTPALYHYQLLPSALDSCNVTALHAACGHDGCLTAETSGDSSGFSLKHAACAALAPHVQSPKEANSGLECQSLLPTLHVQHQQAEVQRNIAQGRPMLVTGLVPEDYPFNYAEFLFANAEQDLQVSGIPYGDVFGLEAGWGTLAEMHDYIEGLPPHQRHEDTVFREQAEIDHDLVAALCDSVVSAPLYVFDAQAQASPAPTPEVDPTEWRTLGLPIFHEALRNVYRQGGSLSVRLYQQLYVGPRCSGAPWHHHQDAWNHLVQGSKLWWLEVSCCAGR